MICLQCHPAMEEQFYWGVGKGVVCLLALMHLFGLKKLFSGDNVLTDCTQYQSVLTAGLPGCSLQSRFSLSHIISSHLTFVREYDLTHFQ